jgi:hypothetical protein
VGVGRGGQVEGAGDHREELELPHPSARVASTSVDAGTYGGRKQASVVRQAPSSPPVPSNFFAAASFKWEGKYHKF